MNRRQAFGGVGMLAVGLTGARQVRAAIEFISEGYGLTIDDFTAIWGEGETGQTYLQYPESDGVWFVGQNPDGFVTYLEREWQEGSELQFDDAVELSLTVIPEESNLQQTYRGDFGAILHGIHIDRYESSSLADQLGNSTESEDDFLAETSFVIAYEIVPPGSEFGQAVRRFSIIHESAA